MGSKKDVIVNIIGSQLAGAVLWIWKSTRFHGWVLENFTMLLAIYTALCTVRGRLCLLLFPPRIFASGGCGGEAAR